MSAHLQRAILLIDQSRYELAETELQQAFGEDPNNSVTHAYHAICLTQLERYKKAKQAAANALKLNPGSEFSLYAAAWVCAATNNFEKALEYIDAAIQINPYDSALHGKRSGIQLELKNWQAALDAANAGLEIDPEDTYCANLRAAALVKLGRKVDAHASIQAALEKEPENALTHANQGWSLLHQSKPKEAMPHFREALRLEPNMEWARAGIIESMKGQYFIYRIMLNWFLWCSKLKGQTLWMIILGGYFGYRFLMNLAANVPSARPFVIPLIVAYLAFVVMSWVSVPMFNLLLRFNRFGRLALSDEEKTASTWVGVCLATALALVAGYFVFESEDFLMGALSIALMTPALALYYFSTEGWPRAVHGLLLLTMIFLASMVLLSLAGSFLNFQIMKSHVGELSQGVFVIAYFPLLLLGVASQFGVQFLVAARPKKGTDTAYWIWVVGGIGLAIFVILFIAMIGVSLMVPDPA